MRVNHAGEIAAQGLYQGHAAVARDPAIEQQMQEAADEELDHLGWCEERLGELGSRPEQFTTGLVCGRLGDGSCERRAGRQMVVGIYRRNRAAGCSNT